MKKFITISTLGLLVATAVNAQNPTDGQNSIDSPAAQTEDAAAPVATSPVKAWEGKITMPTYLLDPAEQSPICEAKRLSISTERQHDPHEEGRDLRLPVHGE